MHVSLDSSEVERRTTILKMQVTLLVEGSPVDITVRSLREEGHKEVEWEYEWEDGRGHDLTDEQTGAIDEFVRHQTGGTTWFPKED